MPAAANPLRDRASQYDARLKASRRSAYGSMTRVLDPAVLEAKGTTRCAKCSWRYEGPLDIGQIAHRNHRAVAHPELAKKSSPPVRSRGSSTRTDERVVTAVQAALHRLQSGPATGDELEELTGLSIAKLSTALGWAKRKGDTTAAPYGHKRIWALTSEAGERWYREREAKREADRLAAHSALVDAIVKLATEEPGLGTEAYTQNRIRLANSTACKQALRAAEEQGRVHRVKVGPELRVYPGARVS